MGGREGAEDRGLRQRRAVDLDDGDVDLPDASAPCRHTGLES